MHDLIIRGGALIDGTGAGAVQADLAVSGDRIATIGDLSDAQAATEIDASGRVVCPGFVDPHNHAYSEQRGGILRIPAADNLIRQGITTILSGACGGSGYPVGEHLEKVEALSFHSNYAAMVGYSTVKSAATKKQRRTPTDAEMDEIRARLREAMEEGAFGVATGILGHSQDVTSTEELIEASRAVAPDGGIYHSHIRDEGEWGKHLDALTEVVRIAREAQVSALSSHIKLWGGLAWGDAEKVDAIFEGAAKEGLDVHADMYGYTGGYRGLNGLVGDLKNRLAPEQLRREPPLPEALEEIDRQLGLIGGADHVILCPIEPNEEIDGKTLLEVADARGATPATTAYDLMLHAKTSCCWLAMRPEDVEHFLAARYTMISTDAHLREMNDGHCHPRNYGNYPRILGHYVRERNVLSLEEAIHRMTLRPARKIGLEGRGRLTEGACADIVVFDPDTIADRASWTDPHNYPAGIDHVIVNGRFAVLDGATTDNLPGRVLRRE